MCLCVRMTARMNSYQIVTPYSLKCNDNKDESNATSASNASFNNATNMLLIELKVYYNF